MANIVCKSATNSLINHIVLVLDSSGSMSSLKNSLIKVVDSLKNHLSVRSQELNQETRISVYFFSSQIECIAYDQDVMRNFSIKDIYNPCGGTALLDGTMKSLFDLEKTSQLYGDHSFLIFVCTDGEENQSTTTTTELSNKIASMPNNWTLAVLVPNMQGVFEAKKFGFPANNIQVWDTSDAGMQKVGDNIRHVTDEYLNNRAMGIRGTQNLFKVDLSNITTTAVQSSLQELNPTTFTIYTATQDQAIKAFVEAQTGKSYVKGNNYYLLNKKEHIQSYKNIFIRERATGKVYGGDNARNLLQLPIGQDIDVKPDTNNVFDIYVESTSVNRKILNGTTVLVIL